MPRARDLTGDCKANIFAYTKNGFLVIPFFLFPTRYGFQHPPILLASITTSFRHVFLGMLLHLRHSESHCVIFPACLLLSLCTLSIPVIVLLCRLFSRPSFLFLFCYVFLFFCHNFYYLSILYRLFITYMKWQTLSCHMLGLFLLLSFTLSIP